MQNYHHQTFDISGTDSPLHLLTPPRLAARPFLLLTFALDWETSLHVEPYNLAAKYFLENGHRAASFDLPSHGRRIDQYGEGIAGFCNAFVSGVNPFARFVEEAKKAIDFCINHQFAAGGNIAVCGTSRAGYLALRLMTADDRIAAAAAFAPVTDWRHLSEFETVKNRRDVAALKLSNYVQGLADKSTFIVIGNGDERVSTASCCRFYLDLIAANHGLYANTNFQICDFPGHHSDKKWYLAGAQFLINALQKEDE